MSGGDFKARCEAVKAALHYPEVTAALDINTNGGDLCPVCATLSMRACADGRGYHCRACGSEGSMIDLVMRTRGEGVMRAVVYLEELNADAGCAATGNLFGDQ